MSYTSIYSDNYDADVNKYIGAFRQFADNPVKEIIFFASTHCADENTATNKNMNAIDGFIQMIEKIDSFMKVMLYPVRLVNKFLGIIAAPAYAFFRLNKTDRMMNVFLENNIEDFYATKFVCDILKCSDVPKILSTFNFLTWKSTLSKYNADIESHRKILSMILMIELASIFSFAEFVVKNNLHTIFPYHDTCFDIMVVAANAALNDDYTKFVDYDQFKRLHGQVTADRKKFGQNSNSNSVQKELIDFIFRLVDRQLLMDETKMKEIRSIVDYPDTSAIFTTLSMQNIRKICKYKYNFFHHKLIEHILFGDVKTDPIAIAIADFEPVPQILDLDCRIDIGTESLMNIIEI